MKSNNGTDRINLYGIRIQPRIGTTPEERMEPQGCEADLTLWLDLQPAAATDSLELSVDYCRVIDAVRQAAIAREYNLLETLAHCIVRDILCRFPASRVGLKIRKRPAGLLGRLDCVEIELERS